MLVRLTPSWAAALSTALRDSRESSAKARITCSRAIAVAQTVGAHVFERVADFSGASSAVVSQGAKTISQLPLLSELPVGGEVMLVGAGLAVLAVALVATRALENL